MQFIVELSWIQKHILLTLVRQVEARPKELLPRGIEPNLFSYYLNALIAKGLIEKQDRGIYRLSVDGEKFVGSISTSTNKVVENIKTVIILWAQRDDETLLFRWSRQPYIGKVTLPHNRMIMGQTIEEGLCNAFEEKLGTRGLNTEYVATALIKIEKNNEIISHMNALIYKVDIQHIEAEFTARNGVAFWGKANDNDAMDGVSAFLDALKNGERLVEATWRYED